MTMKYKENILFSFLFIYTIMCLTSCSVMYKKEMKDNDTIFVSYYPYVYETNVKTTCKSMAKIAENLGVYETLECSAEEFDSISSFLCSITRQMPKNQTCEARMYVEWKDEGLCIGDLNCLCDMEDYNLENLPEVLYLLRCRSGYYNCLDSMELASDALIKIYGIPSDYKYSFDNKSFGNEIGLDMNRLKIRKVALVRLNEK